MQTEQELRFGPYRLDLEHGQLWRGTQLVKLTPKALAVLRQLVQQSGHVVSKEELFQSVWAETVVSDAALTFCIQELRRVLRDDAKEPRYVETVHRRGFRFIAPLNTSPAPVQSPGSKVQSRQSAIRIPQSTITLVGREAELGQLHEWLEKALSGERQMVFVTGEPGIGKTSLAEAFLFGVWSSESQEANQKSKGKNQKAKIRDHSLAPNPQPLAPVFIGRGQCIEHYGTGEPYLPLLEALGRLCREPDGAQLIAVLKQYAPTWLVQMSSLLTTEEATALQGKTAGATRERMLRELAEAIEEMTAERPLVLWLEDLHWSDVSTLDWLAFIARRREHARLMIIGTYRPVDVLVQEHPLRAVKQELQTHGYCTELLLDFLKEEDVAKYLAMRFASPSPFQDEDRGESASRTSLQRLARTIHRRTDGNPLFMVNVINDLVARGVLVQSDDHWKLKERGEEVEARLPQNLQQLIGQQIERLSPETQRMLEAASVAGTEFSPAAVAAGMETEIDGIEEQCEALVRREHFLRASGTADWPDGTVTTQYGFLHALYQEVLYERLPAGRQQRLHQRIGERVEKGYGEQAREIAAELAVHFEQGRDYGKAIQYLQRAGENATQRSAYAEAISLLTRGLELLKTLPDTPERTQQELRLQLALAGPLTTTKGYAAPEVERVYTRALELCRQLGETPQLFWVLTGLWSFRSQRAESQTARELAEKLLSLAQSVRSPTHLTSAHNAMGQVLFHVGEFALAQDHLEQGIALYDPRKHSPLVSGAMMASLGFASRALWHLGYPDQALKRSQEAVALAQELSHPYSLAFALNMAAWLHQFRWERQAVQDRAGVLLALSSEQGFARYLVLGTLWRDSVLAEQGQGEEGVARIRQNLVAYRATGSEIYRPYWLALLAEAYGQVGRAEEGFTALAEALAVVDKTGERWYEAELYRLKGELTLQSQTSPGQVRGKSKASQKSKSKGQKSKMTDPRPLTPDPHAEAEACFHKAIEIARHQQAKSLELRATMSLARLWQQQGKKAEAHQMLSEIYTWFTEGFDTKDLQEAKVLLEELT